MKILVILFTFLVTTNIYSIECRKQSSKQCKDHSSSYTSKKGGWYKNKKSAKNSACRAWQRKTRTNWGDGFLNQRSIKCRARIDAGRTIYQCEARALKCTSK